MRITLIDYHKGNIRSVERALQAAGAQVEVSDAADAIADADALVLPGVGAFSDAMGALNELELVAPIRDAINAGKPFLGICLGLHLMFEGGMEHCEGQPTEGLGIIPGIVTALPREDAQGTRFKIPHVGWNSVEQVGENPLFAGIADGEHFYFTHSYAAPESPFTIGTTTHSIEFPSAVQAGSAWGVQFHPEKSSSAGEALLRNFVCECAR